jgi:putative NADPH-quinone reductase
LQREPLSVPARRKQNFYPVFARNLYDSLIGTRPAAHDSPQPRKLLIVNGHPDPRPERFCAALCDSYETGARSAGWQTSRLNVGTTALAGPDGGSEQSSSIAAARERLAWSNRLVVVFPLWLDQPPEVLRVLFERLARGDAHERVAQIVVTMEMPAFAHRAEFRKTEHERWQAPCVSLCGIKVKKPVFIGSVDTISAGQRAYWLDSIRQLGVEEL